MSRSCASAPVSLLDSQSLCLCLLNSQSLLLCSAFSTASCPCSALHVNVSSYSVEDGRNEKQDTWDISLRDLSEYYFAPLRACVEQADVGAYMCSYDALNGTAACGNEWMNVDVVRSHWGFEGAVESDCGAVEGISSHMHGGWSSATMEVAVAAMNATVSIDCGAVGPKNAYTRNLRAAVDQKLLSRAQLEAAVARVYKGRFAIGEFDAHSMLYKGLPADTIYSAAHQQLSLETAQQSLVLLRNENSSGAAKLPLRPGLKIAVIGPNGNSSHIFQGSYHGANCPNDGKLSGTQVRDESCLPSTLDEIVARNAAWGGSTTFVSGCSGPTWTEATGNKANAKNKDHMPGQALCESLVNISQVNATVAAADVVVLAVGLALQITSAEETDRAHTVAGYALPGKQLELCKLVRQLGKPTVLLHFAGMAVGMDWLAEQRDWPLLVPGYGGRFGPVAVAAALFGEFSPTGKLPYTIYKEDWAAKTPMTDMSLTAGDGRTYKWLGFQNASIEPSFAFGTGTSYTTFGVSVRKTSTPAAEAEAVEQTGRRTGGTRGALLASFSIATTNRGAVAASDATLVFVALAANISAEAPQPRPKKQLVEFVRTPLLEPGASHTEVVHLHAEAFAMADWRGRSVAYSGTYRVLFDNGDGATAAHDVKIAEDAVLDVMPAPPAVKSDDEDTAADESFVVWVSSPTLPNETAVLQTAKQANDLQLCSGNHCTAVTLEQAWARGAKFHVPDAMKLAVWSIRSSAGQQLASVNAAEPWWSICDRHVFQELLKIVSLMAAALLVASASALPPKRSMLWLWPPDWDPVTGAMNATQLAAIKASLRQHRDAITVIGTVGYSIDPVAKGWWALRNPGVATFNAEIRAMGFAVHPLIGSLDPKRIPALCGKNITSSECGVQYFRQIWASPGAFIAQAVELLKEGSWDGVKGFLGKLAYAIHAAGGRVSIDTLCRALPQCGFACCWKI